MVAGLAAMPLLAGPARGQDAAGERPATATHLFVDLAGIRFAPEVRRIFTAGRSEAGRFAAAYRLDDSQEPISAGGRRVLGALAAAGTSPEGLDRARAAVAALESRIRVRTADGRWFILDEAAPLAGHFGASGSGTYREADGRFDGPDDTEALQALIDWTLFWNAGGDGTIRIGPGAFRTTRPLHVGRNSNYHSITLAGAGPAFGPGFAGTRILADHSAGPAIALTGVLIGGIRELSLFGRLRHHVVSRRLGHVGRAGQEDLAIAAWADPGDPRTAESRHAPYAALAVDPFAGARPEGGYDVAQDVPPWLPGGDLYGPAFASTELAIEKVMADGFNTGFVIQPGASDGNGDFIRFRDCTVRNSARGWSIGNSQARATEISDCTAANVHTVISTATHGARNGALRSRITHLSVGEAIDLFDFSNGMAVVGPLLFANLYCEALYRLGHLGPGSAGDAALAFEDAMLNFDRVGPQAVPAYLLGARRNSGYGPGGADAPVVFTRCRFSNFGPLLSLMSANLRLTDCLADAPTPEPEAWLAAGRNAMLGGIVPAMLRLDRERAGIRHARYGSPRLQAEVAGDDWAGSIYGPAALRTAFAKEAVLPVLRGDVWRFTAPDHSAFRAGAVLLDLGSGSLFVVRSAVPGSAGIAVEAVLQNNKLGDTLETPIDPQGQVLVAAVP